MMGKKARKTYLNLDIGDEDSFDDLFEDDFDASEPPKSIHIADWSDDNADARFTARRKIERRKDTKKLYSQLDEWEEFGKNPDRYLY